MRSLRRTALSGLLLLTAGCAKLCAAEDVAMGVARLTTLNADAIANAVNDDTECGFESFSVKMNNTRTGEVGGKGTLTLTVTDCELDFGTSGLVTSTNCRDESTRAFGKATVSGTKTVTGYLTGDALNPIIPEGPDSVIIHLDVTVENFRAEKDGGKATMTWVSGGISGNLRPRLAVKKDTNVCAIQTSNTAFDTVIYKPTQAVLRSGKTTLDVDIDHSDIEGQYGLGPAGENVVSGIMSVWGKEFMLPPDGVEDGLDPEYDAEKFIEGFICDEEIAQPLNYECPQG